MTKEWTWQAERAALVRRVKELEAENKKLLLILREYTHPIGTD